MPNPHYFSLLAEFEIINLQETLSAVDLYIDGIKDDIKTKAEDTSPEKYSSKKDFHSYIDSLSDESKQLKEMGDIYDSRKKDRKILIHFKDVSSNYQYEPHLDYYISDNIRSFFNDKPYKFELVKEDAPQIDCILELHIVKNYRGELQLLSNIVDVEHKYISSFVTHDLQNIVKSKKFLAYKEFLGRDMSFYFPIASAIVAASWCISSGDAYSPGTQLRESGRFS